MEVYQIITERIITLLETGTVPWRQPWRNGNQLPQNLLSKKVYRGINLFLLNSAQYPSPFWLTFRQVQTLGGTVKKGERSFPVVFWKMFKDETETDAKPIPFLRYYKVFNVAQCDGIAAPPTSPPPSGKLIIPISECEQVVKEMPKRPAIRHGGDRACYFPARDDISMPEMKMFASGEDYYCTLFHELVHSTGHASRVGRKEIKEPLRFGSDPYSREELAAEMGAAFLCGHCGIENKVIDQSASYIDNWLSRLRSDHQLVVHAGAQAQRACDFILDVKFEDQPEPEKTNSEHTTGVKNKRYDQRQPTSVA